jgi:transcriptional regulator with XRE-family HTH domain
MNQTQLAEKVGTDQTHISRWERNLAEPDIGTVQRLAAVLRVYAVELLIGRRRKPWDWSRPGATVVGGDQPAPGKWLDAQASILLQEHRRATGTTTQSIEEAENWFATLSLAERDRIGRRLNDPGIVGRYLQTPSIR